MCTGSTANFLVVICFLRSTLAGLTVADVFLCGQLWCDRKTEYCDPLIQVCTPCELPCSRPTGSDRKLCNKLCSRYTKLALPTANTIATLPAAYDGQERHLTKVSTYVYACFGLLVTLVVCACVSVSLLLQKTKCRSGVPEHDFQKECEFNPRECHAKQDLVVGLNNCKSNATERKQDITSAAGRSDAYGARTSPANQPKQVVVNGNARRQNDRVALQQQSRRKAALDSGQTDSGVGCDHESNVPLIQTIVKIV